MTIKTWRHSVLKVLQVLFLLSRNRYLCSKHKAAIYKSYGCKKLSKVFEEASAVSKQALEEAFTALVTRGGMYLE